MKRHMGFVAVACLLVQSCSYGYEASEVQKRYAANRTECRSYAEEMVGLYGRQASGGLPDGNEHLELVEQFARCMEKRGWMVNRPAPSKDSSKGKASGANISPYRV